MNLGRSVFSQLLDFLPTYQFQICVDRYQGNRYVKDFSCWDQFLCLLFAQLTYRRSLRDIEACLRAQQSKLYHMGFRGQVSRNTLAHANEVRDWRIYRDFAQALIHLARHLYRDESFGVDLSETVYAFDSTTIDLCLSLFPWGKFRRHKSAVKLHTLLDVRGSIPTSVYVTGGQVHDVNLLDGLLLEPGAFYLLDRGYVDFARLYLFTQAGAFFVTRAKKNLQFYLRTSRPVDRSSGVRCDQTIRLTGIRTAQRYPDTLRRIVYFDAEKESRLTFLTNNFSLLPLLIAQLYRVRWQVESVLSLDQTAPPDQGLLRYLRERREDASVGRPGGLRSGRHCQKATRVGDEPLSNSRNSQRHDFRKNPDFRGFWQFQRSIYRCRYRYPVEPVRLVMGQH